MSTNLGNGKSNVKLHDEYIHYMYENLDNIACVGLTKCRRKAHCFSYGDIRRLLFC